MTSSPATAASNLDDITASLFYQLRDKNRVYDFDILQCPKCPERLEALELDVYQENGQTYQRIWWTCRGIKNQSCHFPLWVPREVFWTRRTEEQMKTGYIPLPNIHLLPQRLWYLYPNVFRDRLRQGDIGKLTKANSGTITPSSGHATRGSSVRPESVLTENEECSRDSFFATPVVSTGTNPYAPNEMEIWESEIPMRQIRIDEEDAEGNFELVKDISVPTLSSSQPVDREDYEWQSSEVKFAPSGSKDWGTTLIPESAVTTDFPSDSFTDSVVQFCSQTDSSVQQQQQQVEKVNSQEMHSDTDGVIIEVLQSAPQKNTGETLQDMKETECNFETLANQPKAKKKRKRKTTFEDDSMSEAVDDSTTAEAGNSLDRISLVIPAVNTKASQSINITEIREIFQKQKRQQLSSEDVEDDLVVATLMRELVVRVALEHDLFRNKTECGSLSVGQTKRDLLKIISLEEAKRDFGDLTLEELLKGVNNLRSSTGAQNNSREYSKIEGDIEERPQLRSTHLQSNVDKHKRSFGKSDSEAFMNISTRIGNNLEVQPYFRKRRYNNTPSLPRNLPTDEKCIAAVEMALKQSVKGIKGPEETSPAPRTSILKGTPSEFRPDMISSEIFDSQNWRRPVHFGGRTNLDAFVTAYNLRYNRAEYLDALGSELCKRKIMKFVPSIPVKQQRIVRRMQQRRSGQERTLDLETLKKAVDPNTLRVQIAHRLGIKDLDNMLPCSKTGSIRDEVSSKMQHIGSAPLVVSPGVGQTISTEYIRSGKNDEQASTSNMSGSLYSFPVSEYDNEIRNEKEHEVKAPVILSFNDPEVDALVHRKFKNFVYDEHAVDAGTVQHSISAQNPLMPEYLGTATSRIEYTDFESAFEEYENEDEHLDSFFDNHFSHHPL
uniref:Uncharacterized protein n=1 Tax=Setaria digitata TaxID=48799 RepID=A0A915Q2U5_9BILA